MSTPITTGALRLARPHTRRMAAPAASGASGATWQLTHGEHLYFGGRFIEALHTPSHTLGSMCYLLRPPGDGPKPSVHRRYLARGGLWAAVAALASRGGNADALCDRITRVLFHTCR